MKAINRQHMDINIIKESHETLCPQIDKPDEMYQFLERQST